MEVEDKEQIIYESLHYHNFSLKKTDPESS